MGIIRKWMMKIQLLGKKLCAIIINVVETTAMIRRHPISDDDRTEAFLYTVCACFSVYFNCKQVTHEPLCSYISSIPDAASLLSPMM